MQVADLQSEVTELKFDRSKWKPTKFGEVVACVDKTCRNPAELGLTRIVGLDNLDPGELQIKRWGDLSDGTSFTRSFHAGQVLFGKRRAYQRKVALANFDGICSGDILVFEPKGDELLSELLPFLVQSEAFFANALGTSAGSLSPRTKWKELAKWEFLLPPKDDQRRIADLLWAVERSRLQCRAALDSLDTAFETKLESHFGVGNKCRPLVEICGADGIRIGPFGSQLHAHDYVESGVGVVMPYNMERDKLVETNLAFVSEEKATELSRHRLALGDILLPRRGDLTKRGYVTKAEEGWLCGTGSIRIRVPAPYSSRSIYYSLLTSLAQSWLSDNAVGTTMPNLNQRIVASLPICIEDPDQAASAALELDGFLSAKTNFIKHVETLTVLQKGLSQMAFAGDL